MHVAICYDAVIPPPRYGGTERILDWQARALVRMGHKVTLLAREGSDVPGVNVVALPKGAPPEPYVPDDVDVVHLMVAPRLRLDKPYVVSVHRNGEPGETFHPNTLFLAEKHAGNHHARHYVRNGVPVEEYPCEPERGDHLVFLAKTTWNVKNLPGAIRVARAAGLPLEVLGSRSLPLNLHKVLPTVRGVRYHGQIEEEEKRRIISTARGLVFPVRWDDPCPVAVLECLASGCPVYGTPYGSLPELVGDCGVLSTDGRDLVKAIRDGPRFDPKRVRQRILDGFTVEHMTRGYVRYYERVVKTGRIEDPGVTPATPRTREGWVYHKLMPWRDP